MGEAYQWHTSLPACLQVLALAAAATFPTGTLCQPLLPSRIKLTCSQSNWQLSGTQTSWKGSPSVRAGLARLAKCQLLANSVQLIKRLAVPIKNHHSHCGNSFVSILRRSLACFLGKPNGQDEATSNVVVAPPSGNNMNLAENIFCGEQLTFG